MLFTTIGQALAAVDQRQRQIRTTTPGSCPTGQPHPPAARCPHALPDPMQDRDRVAGFGITEDPPGMTDAQIIDAGSRPGCRIRHQRILG